MNKTVYTSFLNEKFIVDISKQRQLIISDNFMDFGIKKMEIIEN